MGYDQAWDSWYGPYFEMINNGSLNIRSFCCMLYTYFEPILYNHIYTLYTLYTDINWDWWNSPGDAPDCNWGQAEINYADCSSVGPKYQQAIKSGKYMNAQSKESTKSLLGM